MSDVSNFEILESPVDDYGFLVLSKNYESITDKFTLISKELNSSGFKGKVMLDYLLSKGSLKERFFEIYFNGKNFDVTTFKLVSNIDKSLEALSINYYNSHYNELVKNSILSKPAKFLIRKKAHI